LYEVADIKQLAEVRMSLFANFISAQEQLHAATVVFNVGEYSATHVAHTDQPAAYDDLDIGQLTLAFGQFKCLDGVGSLMGALDTKWISLDA
jgi:hypothetical protein